MFYDRLVTLCRLHGTNITEVAVTHLNVASSAPSSWKKGASPRSDVVIRAAEHFGVSTDYLLGLTDLPTPPASGSGDAPEVQAAAARLCSASPTARATAIAAMQTIIDVLDT